MPTRSQTLASEEHNRTFLAYYKPIDIALEASKHRERAVAFTRSLNYPLNSYDEIAAFLALEPAAIEYGL